jgi:hypothetical protein
LLSRSNLTLLTTLLATASLQCEVYDPPPDVTLEAPQGGAWTEGQPVALRFSEPVNPASISLRVWRGDVLDIENQIPADAVPLVDNCTLNGCDPLELTLNDERTRLELSFPEDSLGQAGPPLLLQVLPGLEDDAGRRTGWAPEFTIQFRSASACDNQEPVEFQNGMYIMAGSVTRPLPAIVKLISDVRVNPDGTFLLAGADGDAIGDFDPQTINPDEIELDTTANGWTMFVRGQVCLRNGQRLLETEIFDVNIPLSTFTVNLSTVKLVAEIIKDDQGNDLIDGALSYEAVRLIRPGQTTAPASPGGSAALRGTFIPADKPQFPNSPRICGDLCGAVVGKCEPPDGFPPQGACD